MDWPGLIKELAPLARASVLEAFQSAASAFDAAQVNTPLRQAHFLAQAAHETGGFSRLEEGLNYSAKRILEVFKSVPSATLANRLANNPEALANYVYDDAHRRNKLGNTQPGDGWRYRGRGIFQLTGRANYEAMGKRAQLPLLIQPELAISSRYLLPIALSFWTSRGLNAFADEDDLVSITRRINGGENGLGDRAAWLARFKEALGA